MNRLPTYCVSHGGAPWPWMKAQSGSTYDRLEASLQEMARALPEKPRAVLVVTGRWEEAVFTLSSSAAPGMIYDYSGFPEQTYRIKYPAPSAPELATRIHDMLNKGGVAAALGPERGFDHGTSTVMAPGFSQADIPVVQLSLQSDLDPGAHIWAGRLHAPLRDDRILSSSCATTTCAGSMHPQPRHRSNSNAGYRSPHRHATAGPRTVVDSLG